MTEKRSYEYYDIKEISEALVGRKIVHAEMGGTYPAQGYRHPEGMLVLDDGTKLYLTGNEGCGGCSSGWYELERVGTVDNVITDVTIFENPDDDDHDTGAGVYSIFVFAENQMIEVANFQGSDGNGYYGTGFNVTVVVGE
jgi:hypothetical protein